MSKSNTNKIVATKQAKPSTDDILTLPRSFIETIKRDIDKRLSATCECSNADCAMTYPLTVFKSLCGMPISAELRFNRYVQTVAFMIKAGFVVIDDDYDDSPVVYYNKLLDNRPEGGHSVGCRRAPPITEPVTYTIEIIEQILNKIRQIIISLEFDKQTGYFKPAIEAPTTDLAGWHWFAELCPNLVLRFDKCCVCHEYTNTRTKCSHSLCYMCWGGIKLTSDADDDMTPKCPMCRCDISTLR